MGPIRSKGNNEYFKNNITRNLLIKTYRESVDHK
jgi:hypothetical protein